MRYASEIKLSNGVPLKYASVMSITRALSAGRELDDIELDRGDDTVCDTSGILRGIRDERVLVKVDGKFIDIEDVDEGVVGVGIESSGRVNVVRYSDIELKLFEYIDSVIETKASNIQDGDLYVTTYPVVVSVLDMFGTVFQLDDCSPDCIVLTNLWDLLIRYCKSCKENIMHHPAVYLDFGDGGNCVCVRFLETSEAKRFFMKMAMGAAL